MTIFGMPRIDMDQAHAASAMRGRPTEVLTHEIHGDYLLKWLLMRMPDGSARYINEFRRSDADEELHDHPWDNESLMVSGGYWEIGVGGRRWIGVGDRVARRAGEFHRVELEPGITPVTVFDHGPKVNDWGFMDSDGVRISRDEIFARSESFRV